MKTRSSSSTIYDNCLVRDLNGEPIFLCDLRRINWYLRKGLARQLSSKPPEYQLLFETKGPGHKGDPVFLKARENRCVVCGTKEYLSRHHILPHCYRRWFPRELDRYGVYDVMTLCVQHHEEYERHAWSLKKQIARDYGVPISGSREASSTIQEAAHCAAALLGYRDQMPTWRECELEAKIIELLDCEYEITDEFLKNLLKGRKRKTKKTCGQMVVEQLTGPDIDEFTIRWRRHFLRTMRPRFLPDHWRVDRAFHCRRRGENGEQQDDRC